MTLSVRARRATATFTLDVAFSVPAGVTVLFGPSGAGKSTTLRIVAGLEGADSGHVSLGDEVWYDAATKVCVPVHERGIGFVFQSLALFPHLTAEENAAYGMERSASRRTRRERAVAILERMKVGHLVGRKPSTFSGGEAQRVALARMFAMQPRVVLLDEPFSAMDRELRRELCVDVKELVTELGVPAILITHHRNEARALGDRMVKLRGGQVEAVGLPEILLHEEHEDRGLPLDFLDTPMPIERRPS